MEIKDKKRGEGTVNEYSIWVCVLSKHIYRKEQV